MSAEILILGASSEIGLALIERIHGQYGRVIAHFCRSDADLLALQKRIGARLVLEQADFSDDAQTDEFVARIAAKYPEISRLVHLPAGKISYARFPKKNWDGVQNELDIQLRSIYKVLQALLPKMAREGAGRIVFALSSCTQKAPGLLADYTAVKFALLGLMQSLAAEYAGKGVCVNAVSPSMIETKLLEKVPHLLIEENAKQNPTGRNARVSDVVPAIEFLLSDSSGFLTGQNILISGGGS